MVASGRCGPSPLNQFAVQHRTAPLVSEEHLSVEGVVCQDSELVSEEQQSVESVESVLVPSFV